MFSNEFLLIAAAVALALGVLALIVFTFLRNRKIVREIKDFADSRGYEFEHSKSTPHSGAILRLRGEDGTQIDITRPFAGNRQRNHRAKPGATRVDLPSPTFNGGLAVYSTAVSAGAARAASGFVGIFDNDFSRNLLSRFFGDELGQNLGQMQDFPAPDGVSVSILASSNPNADYDAGAIAEVLSGFTRRRGASTGPMLLISERGMSLRLDRDITDPILMGEILDSLHDLAGRIRLR